MPDWLTRRRPTRFLAHCGRATAASPPRDGTGCAPLRPGLRRSLATTVLAACSCTKMSCMNEALRSPPSSGAKHFYTEPPCMMSATKKHGLKRAGAPQLTRAQLTHMSPTKHTGSCQRIVRQQLVLTTPKWPTPVGRLHHLQWPKHPFTAPTDQSEAGVGASLDQRHVRCRPTSSRWQLRRVLALVPAQQMATRRRCRRRAAA